MATIQTCTGREFDLLRPTPAMISPIDIAVQTGRIPRFNGGTTWCEWHVAQHMLLTGIYVEEELAQPEYEGIYEPTEIANLILWAHLHDAHETWYHDLTGPMIKSMRQVGSGAPSAFDALDHLGKVNVARWAGLPLTIIDAPVVVEADRRMLATERELFMRKPWIESWPPLPDPYVTHADLQAPPDIRITSSLAGALDDGVPRRILANQNALRWMPMPPYQAAGQWFARLAELRPDLVEDFQDQPMPWLQWPKWADDVAKAMRDAGVA